MSAPTPEVVGGEWVTPDRLAVGDVLLWPARPRDVRRTVVEVTAQDRFLWLVRLSGGPSLHTAFLTRNHPILRVARADE